MRDITTEEKNCQGISGRRSRSLWKTNGGKARTLGNQRGGTRQDLAVKQEVGPIHAQVSLVDYVFDAKSCLLGLLSNFQ